MITRVLKLTTDANLNQTTNNAATAQVRRSGFITSVFLTFRHTSTSNLGGPYMELSFASTNQRSQNDTNSVIALIETVMIQSGVEIFEQGHVNQYFSGFSIPVDEQVSLYLNVVEVGTLLNFQGQALVYITSPR